ncbi:MAG: hypothetical protein Kow00124_16670 [Anaerolineae bacterium]
MAIRRRITRAALPDSLDDFRAFIEQAAQQAGLDERMTFDLKLAVDEACTNVIEHGYAGREPGEITVRLRAGLRRVTVTISDHGRRFDPAAAPRPDLKTSWRDRRVGGVGLHLLRSMVDKVRYRTTPDGTNHLSLVKLRPAVPKGGSTQEGDSHANHC